MDSYTSLSLFSYHASSRFPLNVSFTCLASPTSHMHTMSGSKPESLKIFSIDLMVAQTLALALFTEPTSSIIVLSTLTLTLTTTGITCGSQVSSSLVEGAVKVHAGECTRPKMRA